MATMSELKATTTARERVEAAVAKAQASQPRLNAVVTFVDVEDQLAALDTIPDGPFHGMPVVLKDNVCTRGVRTTASSKILDNYVPVYRQQAEGSRRCGDRQSVDGRAGDGRHQFNGGDRPGL